MSSRRSGTFSLSPKKKRKSILAPTPVTLSPASRRQSVVNAESLSNNYFVDVPVNDDEAERKERQLNRIQQLQSRNFSPTGVPADRRKSLSNVAGLSNKQLSEHYTHCIHLSTENKITTKNAFSLQLIDYMTEMLRRKDSEMTNFQVASCTLDASTKIYAYRVDSIHTDTIKMAGGLGRAQEKEKKEIEGENSDSDDSRKKKRKAKKRRTIETNIKHLDLVDFDVHYDVDPLFKKISSHFDESGLGNGHFINNLPVQDDSCKLILDSETVMQSLSEPSSSWKSTVSIPNFPDFSNYLICSEFKAFEFSSWRVGDDDSFCEISQSLHKSDSENKLAFDVNAVPEPISGEHFFEADDGFGIDDVANDDNDDDRTAFTIGGEGFQKMPPPPIMECMYLKDHLSHVPLEYSYFDSRVLSAWAGPNHWKLKPSSKEKCTAEGSTDIKKQKKESIILHFDNNEDIEKHFAITRKAIRLQQQTLKLWNTDKTTLPLDLHYDAAEFSRLFTRPGILLRSQNNPSTFDEEGIAEYNYDNQNDTENYCPNDNASNCEDNSGPGYNLTDIFTQTLLPSEGSNSVDAKGDFIGNNLVEAPNKVSKINISYAKIAKKMDMKKLKSIMWMLLETSNDKENERLENVERVASNEKMEIGHSVSFGHMYKALPLRLPLKMAENLSVPLAFSALLHLANEHCLDLISTNISDFIIKQG